MNGRGAWYPAQNAPSYGTHVAGQRLMMPPPPMYGAQMQMGGMYAMPPMPMGMAPPPPPQMHGYDPRWIQPVMAPPAMGHGPPFAAPSVFDTPALPPPLADPVPAEMLRIITYPHPADEAKTLYKYFSVARGSPELERRAVELEEQLHLLAPRIKADLDSRVEANSDAVSLVLGGTTTKTSKTLCLMVLRCLAGTRVYQTDFLHGRKKTAKNCAFFFVRGHDDYHRIVWYKHRIRLIGDAVYIALHREHAVATQALKDLPIPKSETRSSGFELAGHPVDIMLASAGNANKDAPVDRSEPNTATNQNGDEHRDTDSPEFLPEWSAELQSFAPSGVAPSQRGQSIENPITPTTVGRPTLRLGLEASDHKLQQVSPDFGSAPGTADFWVGIAESVLKEGRAPRKDRTESASRDINPLQCCRLAIELNPDSDYGLLWRVTRQALEFCHESSLTITVNGTPKALSFKDCVLRELLADDGEATPWFYLYALLDSTETVSVHGVEYTRDQCLQQACRRDLLPLDGDTKTVYSVRLSEDDRNALIKYAADLGVTIGVEEDDTEFSVWGNGLREEKE